MWLINVNTHRLEYIQDVGQVTKQYAILSHRWEKEEVSFHDIYNHVEIEYLQRRKGWYKIAQCCKVAREEKLKYAWVDTCCIDKSSSAELQESINSMFRWYSEAKVCYVFLSDVSEQQQKQFCTSQWFKRGWTLQELVAPEYLEFYNKNWEFYGTRDQLKQCISEITSIPKEYLGGFNPQWVGESAICIAEIMSWAANRQTTRIEDRAYSLIGLFGVSMPLLYGEGDKSFRRLQEELLRSRDDQSIFAWKRLEEPHELSTALADSPDNFTRPPGSYQWLSPSDFPRRKAHLVSNEGINIELDLLSVRPGVYHAIVNALLYNVQTSDHSSSHNKNMGPPAVLALGFPVREIDMDGRFVRLLPFDEESLVYYPPTLERKSQRRQVTLVNYLKRSEVDVASRTDPPAFFFSDAVTEQWSVQNSAEFLRKSSENMANTTPVHAPAPEKVSVICKWSGWPHTLYWSLGTYPIQGIGLGFDFDFNPVCLIIVGSISNHQSLIEALRQIMSVRGPFEQLPANPESNVFAFSVEKGTYILRTSTNLKLDKPDDAMLLLAVKATRTTRSTGAGLSVKISFGQAYGEYYSSGSLQVLVSRKSNTIPWQVDIIVRSGDGTKQLSSNSKLGDILKVSPFPARRLGTWAEAKDTEEPQTDMEQTNMASDDDSSIL